MMKMIPYYVVVNLEAFILCFSGEYLSSKVRAMEKKDIFDNRNVNSIINLYRFWDRDTSEENNFRTSTKLSRNYVVQIFHLFF